MTTGASTHTVELVLGIVSVVFFVGTIAAIPWAVRRLPADYFVRPPPQHALLKKIARNVLGALLIIAGIAMLVLPGQGILTILVGLSIVDLPIKHRIMRWLLQQPKVRDGIQHLRESGGKPPLVIPAHA
jgi:hypothetical protein